MLQKRRRTKKLNFTIQMKLISIFLLTTVILFSVNLIMYANINTVIVKIESIYASNRNLSDLQSALDQVQASMLEYLSTKSSDSMEEYFRSEQDYQNYIKYLNNEVVNDEALLMEKNIRNMSENYLKLTNAAIETKRNRNISKYVEAYEAATTLNQYIDDYIYSLNNQQFQNNSENYEVLSSSFRYLEIINMTILCITSILSISLIIMLLRDITKPLKELAFAANQVADGNLEVKQLKLNSHDEIGVVTNAFNQMLSSLKDYVRRLRESMELEGALKEKELLMEAHLKDAQLKYLQSQINPHFLFNTLNAGAQLAMMENADKTYRYVQNVADFFRYNLRNNAKIVTIQEEIEMVDHYVYIINVRYSNEIHYKKNIDESLINVAIPSMILQPIVENSIKYGINNIEWDGYVELSVLDNGDNVKISIKDNGIGISKEKIEKILNGTLAKEDLGENSGGIGLDNLIGRLRLYLGAEGIFEITSPGADKGTEVIIQIPKVKENADV